MIRSLFTFAAYGLLALCPGVLAQTQQVVRLQIGENTYEIRYSPETQDVAAVARDFCIRQQGSLGYNEANPLTEANIGNCANPVADYIRKQAASANAAAAPPATKPPGDLYSVRIPVNGQVFEVRFRPDSEPFERVAADFCIAQQAALGFNETNPLTEQNIPNCYVPIARYLQDAVVKFRQGATAAQPQAQPQAATQAAARQPAQFSIRVPVDDKVYEIPLREGQYVADIARQFCIEQRENLGFTEANPLTEANIGLCVNPIATYLQNSIAQYNQQQAAAAAPPQAQQQTAAAADGMVTVPVTIENKQFQIRFRPATDAVEQVARTFCTQQAAAIGVTQDTFASCVNQVGQYLANQLK